MAATSNAPGAARYLPEERDLDALRDAAQTCHGCSLFEDATQTVFGNGHPGAPLMLVGEQPGDQVARALEDAGVDPALVYETNAVKHFKFTRKGGKRRIHQKPGRTEVVACQPWLIAEIEAVRPQVIVCLGATAAQSLLGTTFRVSTQRGQQLRLPSSVDVHLTPEPIVVATVHPSSVLRDRSDQHDEVYKSFVDDLRSAGASLAGRG
jgi:DNA polymerase